MEKTDNRAVATEGLVRVHRAPCNKQARRAARDGLGGSGVLLEDARLRGLVYAGVGQSSGEGLKNEAKRV